MMMARKNNIFLNVMDAVFAEHFKKKGIYGLISIRSSHIAYKMKYRTKYKKSLITVFDDIEDNSIEGELFDENKALEIKNFTKDCILKEINDIVIHCDAGLSRSPAIACALRDKYGYKSNVRNGYELYNLLVYETMMKIL